MNGSKSTFKRKGYWLTAFAAAVLLAASPGTASAQVTIAGSRTTRPRPTCKDVKTDVTDA